jgi:hypothetical protein
MKNKSAISVLGVSIVVVFAFVFLLINYSTGTANSIKRLSIPSGAILILHLDEPIGATTFTDSSGNGHNAGCTGSSCPTAGSAGMDGTSVHFNGENQLIIPEGIDLSNSSFTVSFWGKRDLTDTYPMMFLGQGTATYYHALHLGFFGLGQGPEGSLNNKFVFNIYEDNPFFLITPAYTDTDWHHWACTFDGTTLERKIYRDGVIVAENTAQSAYLGSGPLYLGSSSWPGNNLIGSLDEVILYKRVLSASEVLSLMGSHAYTPTPTETLTPTPTATPCPTCNVDLVLDPASIEVSPRQPFTITIRVDAGLQSVDGVSAYLDFDPTILQVQSISPVSDKLPQTLQNTYNNTTGEINYAAGAFTNFPNGTFAVAKVRLIGVKGSSGSSILFHNASPRLTNVTFGGTSRLRYVTNAIVVVQPARILIDPQMQSVGAGEIFTVTVKAITGAETIDRASAYLDFDPQYLKVVSVAPGTSLPHVVENTQNNTVGTLNYTASISGTQIQGTIPLATISFQSIEVINDTRVIFHTDSPRTSSLTSNGVEILGNVVGGSVKIGALLGLKPLQQAVGVDQVFTITVHVNSGSLLVDGAAAYLNFDPMKLQVQAITADTARLPVILENSFSNLNGEVNYSAGALTNFPNGDFDIAKVRFKAITETVSTLLSLSSVLPRQSDLTYNGSSILGAEGQSDILIAPGYIEGRLTMQRPSPAPNASWSVPLNLKLYLPGQSNPQFSTVVTTDDFGVFYQALTVQPGTYDVCVKNNHSLCKSLRASLSKGTNQLDFGILKEGDANNNNIINILDFSVLSATFSKCIGVSGYDDRADFNEDDCVDILDFSLLASNFQQMGEACPAPVLSQVSSRTRISGAPLTALFKPNGTANIELYPSTPLVLVGDIFTVTVRVLPGGQPVDGVGGYIDFNPDYLQVLDIVADTLHLPIILVNQYDNTLGQIDYAAGTFSNFPTMTFTVFKVRMQAKALTPPTGTSMTFHSEIPRQTDVTYGGNSILLNRITSPVYVVSQIFKIELPTIMR